MIYALHGAVGLADDWKDLASSMSPHRVARVDLWRYLMCCETPLVEFGTAFNKEVESQVRNTGKKPILLGYSMGARLALHALIDNPEMWGGVVIVSGHPGLDLEFRGSRLAADTEWAFKALKDDWSSFLTEWNAQGVLGNNLMPSRESLKSRRQPIARSFVDWSLGNQDDLLPKLVELQKEGKLCPILWLVGGNDAKFKNIADQVNLELPSVELRTVANSGHRVPWEQPEVFSQAVHDFVKKLG